MNKFFVVFTSQAFSIFGSAIVQFALAWYLARYTGKATVLSTALIAAVIPRIILGPLAGPFIDRWSRKKIMIFADLTTALFTLMLVVLFYTKHIQVWHVYLAMVGRSVGDAFQNPALGASIPMIVPEKQLVRANGLFQMLQNAVQIIAPVAGAFLMEQLPMQSVLSVDVITAALAIGCLLPVRIPQPVRAAPFTRPDYPGELKQGFRYIRDRKGLVALTGMMAALMFFAAPAGSLFPVMVNKHLEGDVIKLGWITSAQGIGGICGGLLLGVWGGFKKKILTSFFGFALLIPGSIVIGFTNPQIFYGTSVPAMLLMGVGTAMIGAPLSAIMNAVVAKDIQGRVFSSYQSAVALMIPLGLLTWGPVADALDIRALYWIAAAAWVVILPLAMLYKPLMELENQRAAPAGLSGASPESAV